MEVTPKKIGLGIFATIAIVLTLSLSSQVVETNMDGDYQIKQAAVSGDMTVRNNAGMYMQGFGNITTYHVSDMYYFSSSNLDGGSGEESQPINVRFNDGGTAAISGFIKFKLSTTEKNQLLVHKEFKSYNSVVNDLIRQHVASALKQTASLMKAEATYSSRRSEFISLAERQIVRGIFATEPHIQKVKDVNGKWFIKRGVRILTDEAGAHVVKKNSPFLRYGIEILDFNVKEIDFDATIDALIAKKKEAQQKMVVAKAKAEEAKQNAITAEEQGKANVALAKADEEVAKIREITQMQKEKQVAELKASKEFNVAKVNAEKLLTVAKLNREAAGEDAAAKLELGTSAAKVAKLKVAAGLTPLKAALIEKDTRIGVARELAKSKFPTTMITSGGSDGGSISPIEIIGINQMMDLVNRVGTTKK